MGFRIWFFTSKKVCDSCLEDWEHFKCPKWATLLTKLVAPNYMLRFLNFIFRLIWADFRANFLKFCLNWWKLGKYNFVSNLTNTCFLISSGSRFFSIIIGLYIRVRETSLFDLNLQALSKLQLQINFISGTKYSF